MAKEEKAAPPAEGRAETQTATRADETTGPGTGPGAVAQAPPDTPTSEEAPEDVDVHPAFLGEPPVVTPETMYPARPGAIVETRPHMQEGWEGDLEMGRTKALPGTQPANAAQLLNRLAEEEENR